MIQQLQFSFNLLPKEWLAVKMQRTTNGIERGNANSKVFKGPRCFPVSSLFNSFPLSLIRSTLKQKIVWTHEFTIQSIYNSVLSCALCNVKEVFFN